MSCNNPKVLFYEWSNINATPLGFMNIESFKKFCNKSKIIISSNNDWYLTNYNTIYAICKNGKPELVISGDYKGLKKNFNKHCAKLKKNGI